MLLLACAIDLEGIVCTRLDRPYTSGRSRDWIKIKNRMLRRRTRIAAKLTIKAHPHMLRHACGYALANRGNDTRALQALSRP